MSTPQRGGPPKNEAGPATGPAPTATSTLTAESSAVSCPECAVRDQVCTCEFYAGWATWPTVTNEPVGEQLRRRRAGAQRSPRLACGRRDPNSVSWW